MRDFFYILQEVKLLEHIFSCCNKHMTTKKLFQEKLAQRTLYISELFTHKKIAKRPEEHKKEQFQTSPSLLCGFH